MEILTERLCLNFVEHEDIAQIHHLHSFPEVDEFNTTGIPAKIEDTEQLMAPLFDANHSGTKYTFSVKDKKTNEFIGMVGVVPGKPKYYSAEVWYKIIPNEWGQGYGTEILKTLIQFCFNTLNTHRVEAGCAVANIGSIRVMEKCGMQLEGRRRQTLPLKTGWSDNFEYAILDVDLL